MFEMVILSLGAAEYRTHAMRDRRVAPTRSNANRAQAPSPQRGKVSGHRSGPPTLRVGAVSAGPCYQRAEISGNRPSRYQPTNGPIEASANPAAHEVVSTTYAKAAGTTTPVTESVVC